MKTTNQKLTAIKVKLGMAYDQAMAARLSSGDERLFAIQLMASDIADAAQKTADLMREEFGVREPGKLSGLVVLGPKQKLVGGNIVSLRPRK